MTRSLGFGSTTTNYYALFRLGFPPAPQLLLLNQLVIVTRRLILQKARHHRLYSGFDFLWVYGFRFFFTPLTGVLFIFPSRYYFSIGCKLYLALDRGRPRFRQGFSCLAVLRYRLTEVLIFRLQGFHLLCLAFPKPFCFIKTFLLRGFSHQNGPTTPHNKVWFRLFRFRSPLLPESLLISFPRILRWFSSPSFTFAFYLFKGQMTVS